MAIHDNTYGHLLLQLLRVLVTIDLNVNVLISLILEYPWYHLLLEVITSVKLVCQLVKVMIAVPFMPLIPCGMVKVVVQLAHAAHLTIHHGFVNNFFSQPLLIWKYDCVRTKQRLQKTFQ